MTRAGRLTRDGARKLLVRYYAMTSYEQPNQDMYEVCLACCASRYGEDFAEEVADMAAQLTEREYANYHEPPTRVIRMCRAELEGAGR